MNHWLLGMQLVIWIITPTMSGSTAVATKNMLGFIVFFQYLPRLFRIFPLTSQMVRNTGVLMETAWAGAAYNLLLYLLASHVSPLLFSLISSYTYTGSSDSLQGGRIMCTQDGRHIIWGWMYNCSWLVCYFNPSLIYLFSRGAKVRRSFPVQFVSSRSCWKMS